MEDTFMEDAYMFFKEDGRVDEALYDPLMQIVDALEEISRLDPDIQMAGVFATHLLSALATQFLQGDLQDFLEQVKAALEKMGALFPVQLFIHAAAEIEEIRAMLFEKPAQIMIGSSVRFGEEGSGPKASVVDDEELSN